LHLKIKRFSDSASKAFLHIGQGISNFSKTLFFSTDHSLLQFNSSRSYQPVQTLKQGRLKASLIALSNWKKCKEQINNFLNGMEKASANELKASVFTL